MNEIKKHIETIVSGKHLKPEEAERVFQIIMNGGATPAQIAAVLVGLKINGETEAEITAGVKVIRSKATKFSVGENTKNKMIDVCGTGGDASGTYNISTAVAFVVAACGVPVANHGNRAVSSRSGSADVLEALGVKVEIEKEIMEQALEEIGICFLMAPVYHSAMRHVAPTRKELGIRTIFNLFGPLSNPAGATRQIIGVYSRDLTEKMAYVLNNLGTKKAWIVHGLDGLDEITTAEKTYVAELNDGKVRTFVIDPEEYDIEKCRPEELKGGDASENAIALHKVLLGEKGAYRDIVVINAAAALVVADRVEDLEQGIKIANKAIDEGKAKEVLAQLVEITGRQEDE